MYIYDQPLFNQRLIKLFRQTHNVMDGDNGF